MNLPSFTLEGQLQHQESIRQAYGQKNTSSHFHQVRGLFPLIAGLDFLDALVNLGMEDVYNYIFIFFSSWNVRGPWNILTKAAVQDFDSTWGEDSME